MLPETELKERVLIVYTPRKGTPKDIIEEQLEEIMALVYTAGGFVVSSIYQEIDKPNPATYIGKGKVEEIKNIIDENQINLVIFDTDLSPVQTKNLETAFMIKVIDRTTLILDIFAKHARTLEAKLQVELAQLLYLLPRLTRLWTHLSKQYGGIGTKGPGETQIETDRRLVKSRIQKLQTKLKEIAKHKEIARKLRKSFFKFTLVGYTNAGKSTLMKTLTNANVLIEDKLFATLDTTTRALKLPNGKIVLLSDTVGFIRKLPAHLIASFRSTLYEAHFADALIHVCDGSHKFFREQIETVNQTLQELELHQKPIILVINKIDKIQDKEYIRYLRQEFPQAILISAERGINIGLLLDEMQRVTEENTTTYEIVLPYDKLQLIPYLYKISNVLKKESLDEGMKFIAKPSIGEEKYFKSLFNSYIVE